MLRLRLLDALRDDGLDGHDVLRIHQRLDDVGELGVLAEVLQNDLVGRGDAVLELSLGAPSDLVEFLGRGEAVTQLAVAAQPDTQLLLVYFAHF
ncbi:MAG: hypothetical protein JWO54_194 [Candidatus Saccharibacteria bacterium]|nr:hypothetical protein [Candidatus Saccharibacteria bacterium]